MPLPTQANQAHPLLAPLTIACSLISLISYNTSSVGALAFLVFIGSATIAVWGLWTVRLPSCCERTLANDARIDSSSSLGHPTPQGKLAQTSERRDSSSATRPPHPYRRKSGKRSRLRRDDSSRSSWRYIIHLYRNNTAIQFIYTHWRTGQ